MQRLVFERYFAVLGLSCSGPIFRTESNVVGQWSCVRLQSKVIQVQTRSFVLSLVLAIASLVIASSSLAESGPSDHALTVFLQGYLRDDQTQGHTSRFSSAPLLLDEHTPMVFVYLSGPEWCGSGGCTALLIARDKKSFKLVQKFTLVNLPIRVLCSLTNGWHDLAFRVHGGGVSNHPVVLRFNGSRYPSNPSAEPVAESAALAGCGQDLPLGGVGERLYP